MFASFEFATNFHAEHDTKALDDWTPVQAVGDHERPEGIFNSDRHMSSFRGHATGSNSPFLPSPSETNFTKFWRTARIIHSLHSRTELRSVSTPETDESATQKSLDDRAERIKIAKRLSGDVMTADHKARNEEQESRLHCRVAVVVQELATRWVQRVYMQDQFSSTDAKKSQKIHTSRRKPNIHKYGDFGIF